MIYLWYVFDIVAVSDVYAIIAVSDHLLLHKQDSDFNKFTILRRDRDSLVLNNITVSIPLLLLN